MAKKPFCDYSYNVKIKIDSSNLWLLDSMRTNVNDSRIYAKWSREGMLNVCICFRDNRLPNTLDTDLKFSVRETVIMSRETGKLHNHIPTS